MTVTTTPSLANALLVFQSQGIELQKDSINPHFRNKYISLDSLLGEVLPLLNELHLILLQLPDNINGEPALTTTIIFTQTGEQISSTMPLVLGKNDPQGQGSAITYARRYALMSILGLTADEDNDGEGVRTTAKAAVATGSSALFDVKQKVIALATEQGVDPLTPDSIAAHFGIGVADLQKLDVLRNLVSAA